MTKKIKTVINYETNRILEEDMKEFGNKKPSGEINANEFLCNVAIRMYKERITEKEYYLEQFKCISNDINFVDTITNKAISIKTNLDTNTLDFLPTLNKTIILYTNKFNENDINEIYYNGVGKNNTTSSAYFRSLFNEYASKSKIEREKIYFRELITKIHELEFSEKICCITYDKETYYLSIETPAPDFGNYNLYACAINLKTKKPVSFKINKIRNLTCLDYYYKTCSDEWESMGDRWCSGDMDSLDELLEIHFELTASGEKKFSDEFYKQKYNPDIRNNKGTSYCKTTQEFFFNYFISYGSDIKVISPEPVKQRFAVFYEHSYKNFNK